jgi:hypothetical protein
MPTTRQNEDFGRDLFPSDPLDTAVEWIGRNLGPDDVFDDNTLRAYVALNLPIDEVYGEKAILSHVQSTYNPSEVFGDTELENWAEANGFSRE